MDKNKELKKPDIVFVGPFKYKVVFDNEPLKEHNFEHEEAAYGICDNDKMQISVHANIDVQLQREILFHELIHACLFSARHDGTEEGFVVHLTPMLLSVMIDERNRALMEFILYGS